MLNYTAIDHKRFNNLSKQQIGFLVLIDTMNRNNLAITNKPISKQIEIYHNSVIGIINRINKKHPDLINVDYKGYINHKGKITDKENGKKARIITLTKPLYIKGEKFAWIPTHYLRVKNLMLSSKDLRLFAYLSAIKNIIIQLGICISISIKYLI